MVMWLLSAISPAGPYPLLAVVGGPGTAKTTTGGFCAICSIPCNAGKIRRVPKSEDDLFIQAAAFACLVFDNLSIILEWLSDALCTITTGASYTKRQLHTDADEIILTVCLACSHYQRRGSRHAHRSCQPGRYRQSRRHRRQQTHDGTRV